MKKTIDFNSALNGELKYIHDKNLDYELEDHLMDAAHEFYIKTKRKEYREQLSKLEDEKRLIRSYLDQLDQIEDKDTVVEDYLDRARTYSDYHTEGLIKD